MTDIDLDKIEQAVAETQGKKRHAITFQGKRFVLPKTLPLMFGIQLARGDIEGALRSVLDGKLEEFLELGASLDGFGPLAEEIAKLYTGREAGESPASGSSSKSTSTRSRLTSKGSTT